MVVRFKSYLKFQTRFVVFVNSGLLSLKFSFKNFFLDCTTSKKCQNYFIGYRGEEGDKV